MASTKTQLQQLHDDKESQFPQYYASPPAQEGEPGVSKWVYYKLVDPSTAKMIYEDDPDTIRYTTMYDFWMNERLGVTIKPILRWKTPWTRHETAGPRRAQNTWQFHAGVED